MNAATNVLRIDRSASCTEARNFNRCLTPVKSAGPNVWTSLMTAQSDTLSRQWLMLQEIPRHPRKIAARELAQKLGAEGHVISKRTVERDLAALSEVFPLASDEREKPYGWSWHRDAPQFSLPGMSPLQAMVLALAHQHLEPLMPAHLLSQLSPYFRQAESVLKLVSGARSFAAWNRRVAIVQPTQPLLPPKVNGKSLAALHEALLKGHQIVMRYHSRAAGTTRQYMLHPLGIVYRGVLGYLVALIGDSESPRSFALHRIESVRALDAKARIPTDFSLRDFAQSGAFGFEERGPIKLVLRMAKEAAAHLYETPLSEDQCITTDECDGWLRVEATVMETSQLRWWLLGFGNAVEVLAPCELRGKIAGVVQATAAVYSASRN